MEARLPENQRTEPCLRFPGSRSALSDFAEQWERNVRSASSAGRVVVEALWPVNSPFEISNCFGISQSAAGFAAHFWAADSCGGAAYMGGFVNLSTVVCNKSVARPAAGRGSRQNSQRRVVYQNPSALSLRPIRAVDDSGELVEGRSGIGCRRDARPMARRPQIDGNPPRRIKALGPA